MPKTYNEIFNVHAYEERNMRANSKILSLVVSPPPHVCAFSFLYHIHVLTFWAFSFLAILSNTALLNGLSNRKQNFRLKEGNSQD